ncbi:MAG: HipA N-terminal domain-containing protein [Bacteroidota bacterium]
MKSAQVLWNDQLAGILTQVDSSHYEFEYSNAWLADSNKPAISLTFPKTQKNYKADHLFPFFFNMLSEGVNRKLQSRLLRIDEKDDFGLLLATSSKDGIGAVSVVPINNETE